MTYRDPEDRGTPPEVRRSSPWGWLVAVVIVVLLGWLLIRAFDRTDTARPASDLVEPTPVRPAVPEPR